MESWFVNILPPNMRWTMLGLTCMIQAMLILSCDNGNDPNKNDTNICIVGEIENCTCAAQEGTKTCQADGKTFSACDCVSKAPCTNDAAQACTCTSGSTGTQICQNNTWGTCTCISCQPGEKVGCNCPQKNSGSKTCQADGQSYSACTCNSTSCFENSKRLCPCPNSEKGIQTCTNGTWTSCSQCGQKESCTQVGEKKECLCSNNGRSVRECLPDKTWGLCNCGGPLCIVGEIQKGCNCPQNVEGQQVCRKNSKGVEEWGPCTCTCQKDETKACDCPNNTKGTRICGCQGNTCKWNGCQCERCRDKSECNKDPKRTQCNTTLNLCVTCLNDSHCQNKTRCLTHNGSCVACLEDKDCPTAGQECDPTDNTCKAFQRGSLKGEITRCDTTDKNCLGDFSKDKGPIYFLFFASNKFPPPQTLKPFFVHKIDAVDFTDTQSKRTYEVKGLPPGNFSVFVFIDVNKNWSFQNHLPDQGDLVGSIFPAEVLPGKSNTYPVYLKWRY